MTWYGKRTKQFRNLLSLKAKQRYKDPKERGKMKQSTLKAWKDPVKKKRHDDACKNNRFTKEALEKGKLSLIKNGHVYKDTIPEIILQKLLDSLKIPYKKHPCFYSKKMSWHQADLEILNKNDNRWLVIEVDGCYWHGCPKHYPDKKRKKDKIINNFYKENNIPFIRLRECELDEKRTRKMDMKMIRNQSGAVSYK